MRTLLVRAHQPRIACDIGRQDRRQPTLDAFSPGVHARDATAIPTYTYNETIMPRYIGLAVHYTPLQRLPTTRNFGKS